MEKLKWKLLTIETDSESESGVVNWLKYIVETIYFFLILSFIRAWILYMGVFTLCILW